MEPALLTETEIDARDYLDHPSGFLALTPKNRRFTLDGAPGFVSYREQGKHLVAFGGVHAPVSSQAALLDAFLDEATRRKRRVMAVQVRPHQVDLFRGKGFTVNRFGSTFAVDLRSFSFAGTRRMRLRNKIKRAREMGLRVLEVGRELPSDAATFARLDGISAAWLRKKGKKELDFMIGEMGQPGDPERRIFAVLDGQAMLGFITYVPAWGERPGFLHDLTRRLPAAPVGTMELCNAVALQRLREAGAQWLHFGFTPFVLHGEEAPGASRLLAFALRLLGRHGSFVYPAQSQVDYKMKWSPEMIEPEFVAAKPFSLRGIFDLLLLTRSL